MPSGAYNLRNAVQIFTVLCNYKTLSNLSTLIKFCASSILRHEHTNRLMSCVFVKTSLFSITRWCCTQPPSLYKPLGAQDEHKR